MAAEINLCFEIPYDILRAYAHIPCSATGGKRAHFDFYFGKQLWKNIQIANVSYVCVFFCRAVAGYICDVNRKIFFRRNLVVMI